MLRFPVLICVSCVFLGLATGAAAQQHGDQRVGFASESWDATFFQPGGTYDPDVPTPEEILGFPIGRRPVRYDEMHRYFTALANASARVALRVHARTHEDRELVHALISREGRVTDGALRELQARMARFADPRTGESNHAQSDLPLVAWFGYSIHGDELSGCDAAVQVAYQLAAGNDDVTRRLRDSLLVIIDPTQNPDGRERYLAQMQAAAGRVPNPDDQSLQHRGFWPWGRANHYLFDLNRDWFTLVHPESRGRVGAMTAWNPQLVIDAHEMGWDDTYLFSPPREPFNPNLPRAIHRWWDVFARDQAADFGRRGWSHYTREWNEEFFPGYGSSWSMYHGAIGILYEQAGVDGSVVRQPDGSYLTYREAVQHQFQSTLSNLETAMRNRAAILRDYRAGRRAAAEAGRNGAVRAFVFTEGDHPQRAWRLATTLLQQGIEVQRTDEDATLQDLHDFWGVTWKRKRVPAGSYVVLLEQPAAPLVRNLMDFHVAMPDSFLREERDWLERDKGSRLYEVTTWSRPLSNNVETFWMSRIPDVRVSMFAPGGEGIGSEPAPKDLGSAPAGRPSYGYIIDGRRDACIYAVASLLERGMSVRIALEDFSVGGRSYARGSALLRVRSNPESLHDVVREVAEVANVAIHATNSGHADFGPDLGGNRFPALVAPRIAFLTGFPVSFVSYGSLWHLLDHDLGVRVSSLDAQRLRSMDLSKYSVIVLPNAFGGAAAYERALGTGGTTQLLEWVKAGGTLVGISAGTAFAADSSRGFSHVRLRRDVLAEFAPELAKSELPESSRMDALGDAPRARAAIRMPLLGAGATRFVKQVRPRGVHYVFDKNRTEPARPEPKSKPELAHLERADARLRRFRPQGALLRADVDQDDWLTSGVPARLPVLVDNSRALIAQDPVRVSARFAQTDSLHLSGLLWPEAAERIARTACVTRERVGDGQVILFAGDPTYRRATRGSERLLLNALFLGPGLGTERPAPW